MSEKKVPMFFNFLTFFYMSKNERARQFPSFSNDPHSRQTEVSNMLKFLKILRQGWHLLKVVAKITSLSKNKNESVIFCAEYTFFCSLALDKTMDFLVRDKL